MKTLGLTFLVVGLAVAALPAAAQDAGSTSFTLLSYTEGGGGYFTIEGQTERNPTLVVPASTQITVTLKGTDDGVHNIQVAGASQSGFVQSSTDVVTYTFTSGASGTTDYWCVPHKAAGMAGKVRIAGSAEEPAGGNDSPGIATIGILLALVGGALLVRRK